jgi:hypothetical protein
MPVFNTNGSSSNSSNSSNKALIYSNSYIVTCDISSANRDEFDSVKAEIFKLQAKLIELATSRVTLPSGAIYEGGRLSTIGEKLNKLPQEILNNAMVIGHVQLPTTTLTEDFHEDF